MVFLDLGSGGTGVRGPVGTLMKVGVSWAFTQASH